MKYIVKQTTTYKDGTTHSAYWAYSTTYTTDKDKAWKFDSLKWAKVSTKELKRPCDIMTIETIEE